MLPKAPKPTSTSDTRQTAIETIGPKRARREGGRTDPSRTAAIGGTRVARKAGRSAASRVTTVPSDDRDDHGTRGEDEPGLRQVEPERLEELVEALREAEADEQPDDRREDPRHEALEDRRSRAPAARVAPTVRSVANSRVRWAMVIESVLAITNAPTKSAIPPNASRK